MGPGARMNTNIPKGTRVRIKSNGKRGTVVGELAGFVLVQADGSEQDFGYQPGELEIVSESA